MLTETPSTRPAEIIMCRRVSCASCGKPSFAGCGAHVEEVLADVPNDQRCRCREAAEKEQAKGRPKPGLASLLRRIFGP